MKFIKHLKNLHLELSPNPPPHPPCFHNKNSCKSLSNVTHYYAVVKIKVVCCYDK